MPAALHIEGRLTIDSPHGQWTVHGDGATLTVTAPSWRCVANLPDVLQRLQPPQPLLGRAQSRIRVRVQGGALAAEYGPDIQGNAIGRLAGQPHMRVPIAAAIRLAIAKVF